MQSFDFVSLYIIINLILVGVMVVFGMWFYRKYVQRNSLEGRSRGGNIVAMGIVLIPLALILLSYLVEPAYLGFVVRSASLLGLIIETPVIALYVYESRDKAKGLKKGYIAAVVIIIPLVLIPLSYSVESTSIALVMRSASIGVLIASILMTTIYLYRELRQERPSRDEDTIQQAPTTRGRFGGRLKGVLAKARREVRHQATKELSTQVQHTVRRELGTVMDETLSNVAEGLTEQLLDGIVSDTAREAAGELGSQIGSEIARSVTREVSDVAGDATKMIADKALDKAQGAIVGRLRGRKVEEQVKATKIVEPPEKTDMEEQTRIGVPSEGEVVRQAKIPQLCFGCKLRLDTETVTWISDSRVRCPSCGTVIIVGE